MHIPQNNAVFVTNLAASDNSSKKFEARLGHKCLCRMRMMFHRL